MNTGTLFFDKKIIVTAVVYFLISAVLLFKYGIQLGGEAEKFIENANRIINGQELFNGVFGYFYIAYSILVALFIKLSVNLIIIAVLQVILSFIAALCLYKLLIQGLKNRDIAFLFFIVYLLCYPIQKWNFFLYSESVHTSLLVIGIYFFNKWLIEKKNYRLVALGAVLLLILFSRPVGILFLLSLCTALLFWFYHSQKKILFYILSCVGVLSVILILNSPFTAFVNPDSIRRMEIICQVPEANQVIVYKEYNREGLYKAYKVIKDEIGFGNFFKNGFKKLGYFFGMYRSYYSWQNNLLLICFTVFFPFALIGVFSKQDKAYYYIKLFAVVYLLFTSIGIFFTCDEWSNRFISPAFPFILILAAAGFLSVNKRVKGFQALYYSK
jgi:hypothetical protein